MNEKNIRKRESRDHDLHIRLTKSQMDFIDFISYENDKTRSDMIRHAITWYCRLYEFAPEVLKELEKKYQR